MTAVCEVHAKHPQVRLLVLSLYDTIAAPFPENGPLGRC